ncbi:hypothetical protein ACFQZ2_00160 [Streptomonospora algeriensis]|uniref:HTH IS21-type domain-containing protein n=1 Tax=Streptomonospora algeriensis TaxID=995084 RepID=A0ABW3B9T3_9ACTN
MSSSIEVLCRDRATFYAEAAGQGAPQAVQVADRWHLWNNLGQAVERCVSAHRICLTPARAPLAEEESPVEPEESTSPWRTSSRFADRVRETHAAVHDLRAKDHSIRSIQRNLGMGSSTVLRYLRASAPEALFRGQWQNRSSRVDPFKPYLDQQWADGRTNAWKLFEDIKDMGYPGGYGMVRDYLRPNRPVAQPPGPRPPRVREWTAWLLTPPEALGEHEHPGLKQARRDCSEPGPWPGTCAPLPACSPAGREQNSRSG